MLSRLEASGHPNAVQPFVVHKLRYNSLAIKRVFGLMEDLHPRVGYGWIRREINYDRTLMGILNDAVSRLSGFMALSWSVSLVLISL